MGCFCTFKVWFIFSLSHYIALFNIVLYLSTLYLYPIICYIQHSRLRRPISKIRMILLMDTKIWIVSLIIMFAVRPICTQDAIFKMSSVSPDIYIERERYYLWNKFVQWNLYNDTEKFLLKTHTFHHLSVKVFTKSCLFSQSWKTTCLERPQNLMPYGALYRFHCISRHGIVLSYRWEHSTMSADTKWFQK